MKCYIVRVYRENWGRKREFAGVVERVGVQGKKPFTTFEELCEILNPGAKKRAQRKDPAPERPALI